LEGGLGPQPDIRGFIYIKNINFWVSKPGMCSSFQPWAGWWHMRTHLVSLGFMVKDNGLYSPIEGKGHIPTLSLVTCQPGSLGWTTEYSESFTKRYWQHQSQLPNTDDAQGSSKLCANM
jgi:hypothetical protein